MSKRGFDGLLKAWRRALHLWDQPDYRPDLSQIRKKPRAEDQDSEVKLGKRKSSSSETTSGITSTSNNADRSASKIMRTEEKDGSKSDGKKMEELAEERFDDDYEAAYEKYEKYNLENEVEVDVDDDEDVL
jgi:TPR repeat protein